jgi:hypothetical protein
MSLKPSRAEKILATVWLVVRRCVMWTAALFLLGGAIFNFAHQHFVPGIVGLVLVYPCIRLGLYGSKTTYLGRSLATNDRSFHEQHKRRYGWRL